MLIKTSLAALALALAIAAPAQTAPTAPAATPAAASHKPLSDVQLPSGITLADWVAVQAKAEPTLRIAAEAAGYVRQFGGYRELLGLIKTYTESAAFSVAQVTPATASQKLPLFEQARRQLGDWPALTLASARAYALTGELGKSREALSAWLKVAPPSAPDRQKIVDVIIRSESDLAPLRQWANPELGHTSGAEILRRIRDEGLNLEVILVIGHADASTRQDAQALSLKRAEAVRDYFIRNDIDARRIYPEAKGATQPWSTDPAENNRVEVEVVSTDSARSKKVTFGGTFPFPGDSIDSPALAR